MKTLITLIIASALISGAARAAVTFDNLTGAPSFGSAFIGGPTGTIFPNESIAVEITTDSQAWFFDSIDISFGVGFGFGSSDIEVEIYTVGNPFTAGPSTRQALLGEVAPSGTTENYGPAATLTLPANSSFWLHIHVPTGDGEYVANTVSTALGVGAWSVTDARIRVGGSWSGWSQAPAVRINATAVPEVSTALLGGIGLLGLLSRRRC